MKYKLIAIDLDGTLLNNNQTISKMNKQYIKYAVDKGVYVILCSGRSIDLVKRYAQELGLKSEPVITCNGASIVIPENGNYRTIFTQKIQREYAKIAFEYAINEKMKIYAFTSKKMYTNICVDDPEMSFWINNGQNFEHSTDMNIKEDIIKIMFSVDQDISMNVKQELKSMLNDKVKIYFVMNRYIELMDINVSKAKALAYLADIYKIQREHIIAIGDNENDISMIKYAGLGVAMANADELVKKNADYITDNNECDGVAKVIEKFVKY